MAQPPAYVRQYSFTQHSTQYPTIPQPGVSIDLELNTIRTSLNATISNLGLLQRDDAALANNSVGLNQLAPEVLLATLNPPTDWVTATAYARFDIVWQSSALYLCNTDHTSGVFATDLAAVKWTAFLDYSSPLSQANAAAAAALASETAASDYADASLDSAADAADSATAAAASAAAAAAFFGTITFPLAVGLGGTGAGSGAAACASLGALNLGGGTMTGALTLYADPSNALHAASKQYVDNLVNGLKPKGSVIVATTGNVVLTGEQTIDGVLTAATRILVWQNTAPAENGIYRTAAGAWTRDVTMDSWAEVPGATVVVESGSTLADKGYVCTSNAGGTLGVTAVNFVQFLGTGAYQLASANLTVYDANPLAAAELTQLQNINASVISAAQWGYVGAISAYGASIIDDADATAARATLGLGTAAVLNSGTSGGTLPLLNTAVTFSDTLTINKAAAGATAVIIGGANAQDAGIQLRGNSGQSRFLRGQTGSTDRWYVYLGNNTAESGSNAGSDFQILSRDDAGAAIGTAFSIVRSSMLATFGAGVVATGAAVGSLAYAFGGATTRGFFSDTTNTGVGLAVGGAQVGYFNATKFVWTAGQIVGDGSSAGTPAFAVDKDDLDNGLYYIGANNWGLATGGAATMTFTTTATALASGIELLLDSAATAPTQTYSAGYRSAGPTNVKTGNYTTVKGDEGHALDMNAAGATAITIKAATHSANAELFGVNMGAGTMTLTRDTGVTFRDANGTNGNVTVAQYKNWYARRDPSTDDLWYVRSS